MIWFEQYIGTSWKIGGERIEEGLDCWGFFRYIQKRYYNIDVPKILFDFYDYKKVAKTFQNHIERTNWKMVSTCPNTFHEAQDGDAVIMRIGQHPIHIGVFINEYGIRGVLHSLEKVGVVFSDMTALVCNNWKITGVYRNIKNI